MLPSLIHCLCTPVYVVAAAIVERCSLAILPIFFVLVSGGLIIATYCLAVFYQGTSHAWLPRISDTGNYPPASMLFSLTAGLSALLVGIIAMAVFQFYEQCIAFQRDRQLGEAGTDQAVREEVTERANRRSVYNSLLLFSALVSVIGLVTLASFQMNHAYEVHAVGFCILCANNYMYFIGLTQFSRKWLTGIMTERKRTATVRVRIFLIVIGCVCLIGFFSLTYASWTIYDPVNPCPDSTDWRLPQNCSDVSKNFMPEDGGYTLFAISSLFEWVWLLTMFLLFLTLVSELKEDLGSLSVRNIFVKWHSMAMATRARKHAQKSDRRSGVRDSGGVQGSGSVQRSGSARRSTSVQRSTGVVNTVLTESSVVTAADSVPEGGENSPACTCHSEGTVEARARPGEKAPKASMRDVVFEEET